MQHVTGAVTWHLTEKKEKKNADHKEQLFTRY